MVKLNLSRIVWLLVVIFLAACEGAPTTQPEAAVRQETPPPATVIEGVTPTAVVTEETMLTVVATETVTPTTTAEATTAANPTPPLTSEVATEIPAASSTIAAAATAWLSATATVTNGISVSGLPILATTPVLAVDTATPAVKVIDDMPLLSPDVLTQMGVKANDAIWVEAWPSTDEIIFKVGYDPRSTFWAVSRAKVQARQVATLQSNKVSTATIDELRQFDKRVDYVHVSPDGQWGTWGFGETLLVKQLGTNQPPVNLLGVVQFEELANGAGRIVWSPDSKQIAYVIKNGPLNRYEIRVSDSLGQQIKGVALDDTAPAYIAWSPDSQYLAFYMLEEPQSGITHIYLMRQDGSGLTQLTQHGFANGPIYWSPTEEAITYTHGVGDGSRPWLVTFTK